MGQRGELAWPPPRLFAPSPVRPGMTRADTARWRRVVPRWRWMEALQAAKPTATMSSMTPIGPRQSRPDRLSKKEPARNRPASRLMKRSPTVPKAIANPSLAASARHGPGNLSAIASVRSWNETGPRVVPSASVTGSWLKFIQVATAPRRATRTPAGSGVVGMPRSAAPGQNLRDQGRAPGADRGRVAVADDGGLAGEGAVGVGVRRLAAAQVVALGPGLDRGAPRRGTVSPGRSPSKLRRRQPSRSRSGPGWPSSWTRPVGVR